MNELCNSRSIQTNFSWSCYDDIYVKIWNKYGFRVSHVADEIMAYNWRIRPINIHLDILKQLLNDQSKISIYCVEVVNKFFLDFYIKIWSIKKTNGNKSHYSHNLLRSLNNYATIGACLGVCVCVCERERERERINLCVQFLHFTTSSIKLVRNKPWIHGLIMTQFTTIIQT